MSSTSNKSVNKGVTPYLPSKLPNEDTLTRALSYPYPRPKHSFLFDKGVVKPIPSDFNIDKQKYVPFLVVGSNASPQQLQRKYGTSESDSQIQIPVLQVRCHNMDIIYSAAMAFYGSVPSSIIASDNTIVDTHVILLHTDLVQKMNSTERGYDICQLKNDRKQHIEFVDQNIPFDSSNVFIYVAKCGPIHVDGHPVAVSNFSAKHRLFKEMTQTEILTHVKGIITNANTENKHDLNHLPLNEWVVKLVDSQDFDFYGWVRQQIFHSDHLDDCFQIVQTL